MSYAALPGSNEAQHDKGESTASLERSQLCAPSISAPKRMELKRPVVGGAWSTDCSGLCDPPGGCRLCLFAHVMTNWTMGLIVERLEPERVVCGGSFWGGCCLSYWLVVATAAVAPFVGPFLPFYLPLHYHVHRAVAKKYGIKTNAVADCLCVWCCPGALLCQVAREIMIRENADMTPLGAAWPNPPAYN